MRVKVAGTADETPGSLTIQILSRHTLRRAVFAAIHVWMKDSSESLAGEELVSFVIV